MVCAQQIKGTWGKSLPRSTDCFAGTFVVTTLTNVSVPIQYHSILGLQCFTAQEQSPSIIPWAKVPLVVQSASWCKTPLVSATECSRNYWFQAAWVVVQSRGVRILFLPEMSLLSWYHSTSAVWGHRWKVCLRTSIDHKSQKTFWFYTAWPGKTVRQNEGLLEQAEYSDPVSMLTLCGNAKQVPLGRQILRWILTRTTPTEYRI